MDSQPTAHAAADEDAIRAIHQRMIDAWNAGDGAAFAAPFTDDADFVAWEGTHLKGRLEITSFHEQAFETIAKGSRLNGEVKFVRLLGPAVAVMHSVVSVTLAGQNAASPGRDSMQLTVVAKRNGQWRGVALMNARRLNMERQLFLDELDLKVSRPADGESKMHLKPRSVVTIDGDCEVDHAVATLVLAFDSDPVARWMYDDPHQYLLHIPRLFRALGRSSFATGSAQRTKDGLGVALWLPPGVHGDDGSLEAVIAETIVAEKQADVAAVFERTEHSRPTEPHWYLSLIGVETFHRNKGLGAALLQHGLRQCDREHRPAYLWSSNPRNIPLYERHGFEIAAMIQAGSSPAIFPMLRHAR
jgi:uncharacterized protein (TIGR02246 family)